MIVFRARQRTATGARTPAKTKPPEARVTQLILGPMPKPDFTIVTASYNYGRFIRDCIESVQGQEGVTAEHLIFDAGSSDGTQETLKQYPHLRWVCEPDKGMSDAINKGFRHAMGEWVMWLNADDRLKPGALAEVLACARGSRADVIFGAQDYVDVEGRLRKRMRLLPFVPFIHLHHGCYVPSTAAFYRRATVMEAGFLLDDRFHCCMDLEFYARLSKAGKRFHYLPRVLADFRVHENNASNVGGYTRGTLDGEYVYAKATMELEAIRRTYGITLFRHYYLDHGVDLLLYGAASLLKALLKAPYWFALREPNAKGVSPGK